jgi:hypothetical protein
MDDTCPQCGREALRSVVTDGERDLYQLYEHIGCPLCRFPNPNQARPIEVRDTSQPNAVYTARLHRACWDREQIPTHELHRAHEWRREHRPARIATPAASDAT